MAILNLDRMWVNLMSTGQAVAARSKPARAENYDRGGETRTYAGGRRRAIVTAGEVGVFKFTMMMLNRTDTETLHTWIGSTVQVRDTYGRRFFGVYYGIQVNEYRDLSTLWDVDIVLTVVTATEGV